MKGRANAVIDLENVTFRWPGQSTDIVDIDELHLGSEEHLFVRGPSGSGKTTFLNLLAGINLPQSGQINLLGTNLASLSPGKRDQFRADHVGVVFQQFNLLPYLTMLENVTLSCAFSKRKKARATETSNVAEASRHLLQSLNLTEELHNAAVATLSVGQQQRVAVARALIGGPEILIADEPTSALDTENRDRFLDLLFDQVEAHSCTLVFVSHDPQLAKRFSRSIELTESNEIQRCKQQGSEE